MSKHLRHTDALDNLPKREPHRNPDSWGYSQGTWRPTDGIAIWDRVDYILRKYEGKSFDKAFSHFCRQVPVYQQSHFLDKFEPKRRYSRKPQWFVDKQGNIQEHKPKKQPKTVVFKSLDWKTEFLHKVTKVAYKGWPDPNPEADYAWYVTKGWEQEFSSANDPKYKQLMAEKRQQQKAYVKAAIKTKQQKADAQFAEALHEAKAEAKAEAKVHTKDCHHV